MVHQKNNHVNLKTVTNDQKTIHKTTCQRHSKIIIPGHFESNFVG